MAIKIKYVQNVPLERFEGIFFRKLYKEKRSCPLLLGNLSVSSPLSPFWKARVFRRLRAATMGRCPLDPYQRVRTPFGNPMLGTTTARQISIYLRPRIIMHQDFPVVRTLVCHSVCTVLTHADSMPIAFCRNRYSITGCCN